MTLPAHTVARKKLECVMYAAPRFRVFGRNVLEERELRDVNLKDVLLFCRNTRRMEECVMETLPGQYP
jgi:hypothetical protein